jgi:hypothetical protein
MSNRVKPGIAGNANSTNPVFILPDVTGLAWEVATVVGTAVVMATVVVAAAEVVGIVVARVVGGLATVLVVAAEVTGCELVLVEILVAVLSPQAASREIRMNIARNNPETFLFMINTFPFAKT